MSIPTFGATLLIANGLINAIPPLNNSLRKIAAGKPIFQVIIGILSTVVGLALVAEVF